MTTQRLMAITCAVSLIIGLLLAACANSTAISPLPAPSQVAAGSKGTATPMASSATPTGTSAATPPPLVQSPTATSTPTGTETGLRTVTLAESGKTIDLQVGQRFLLDLGAGYDWTVTVDDPSIISRVVNITVVQGAQGVYEAKRPGRTILSAVGDPPCRKAQPPCAAPSRLFQVEITVH